MSCQSKLFLIENLTEICRFDVMLINSYFHLEWAQGISHNAFVQFF